MGISYRSFQERMMRPRTVEDYQERLLTVMVYIQRHLGEPLCLETPMREGQSGRRPKLTGGTLG